MFVKNNSLEEVLKYFKSELSERFTSREIRQISRQLICKRMNWTETDLFTNSKYTFSESDLLFFRSKIKTLLSGEPFQYVIGECFFYNVILKTDKRALIPRPETEELVHQIISDFKNKKIKLLDIGTGSGCIPIALKKENPSWDVYAVDVDEDALKLAKENAALNETSINFSKLDILDETSTQFQDNLNFDVIVSNPPYILESEASEMKSHVLDFEPHKALFVKNDPLIFYKIILKFAKFNLSEDGFVYFEIHENYSNEVKNLILRNGFKNVEIISDLQGKDRIVKGKR